MPNQSDFIMEDGIIAWFNGPEWDQVAEDAMKKESSKIREYAQSNAPWADRSGDARAGLDTDVQNDDGLIELTLFHTVDYGLWLEVIQNGNFAIIMPTLESQGPGALDNVTAAVAGARKGHDL